MTLYVCITAFTERFILSEFFLDTTSDIRKDITLDMTSDMNLDMSFERKTDLVSGYFWLLFMSYGIKHESDIDSNMTKYQKWH